MTTYLRPELTLVGAAQTLVLDVCAGKLSETSQQQNTGSGVPVSCDEDTPPFAFRDITPF